MFINWLIQIVLGLLGLGRKPQPTVEAQATARAAAAETTSQVDATTATRQAAIASEVDAPKSTPAVVGELNKGRSDAPYDPGRGDHASGVFLQSCATAPSSAVRSPSSP